MRRTVTTTSISWIPSESVWSAMRSTFDLGITHWDPPPPQELEDREALHALHTMGRFRFANVLEAWVEVEDGRITDAGFADTSGIVMGSTTVMVGPVGATLQAVSLPDLRDEPARVDEATVRFRQTVGGRTAFPLPRPVPHRRFLRWQAPLVWTTLELTVRADGTSEVALASASAFPRHWVYDAEGAVALKSGLTDEKGWMGHSFGARTPWGQEHEDRPTLVVPAESALERGLSGQIMKRGTTPEVRRVPEGAEVTRQGEPGDELFLLLDGVLAVVVDGAEVGEVGPGAILGERALLEGGRRTSTLVARTPVRLAVAGRDQVDTGALTALAATHHREDAPDTQA